jgi:hypothetical protein
MRKETFDVEFSDQLFIMLLEVAVRFRLQIRPASENTKPLLYTALELTSLTSAVIHLYLAI